VGVACVTKRLEYVTGMGQGKVNGRGMVWVVVGMCGVSGEEATRSICRDGEPGWQGDQLCAVGWAI